MKTGSFLLEKGVGKIPFSFSASFNVKVNDHIRFVRTILAYSALHLIYCLFDYCESVRASVSIVIHSQKPVKVKSGKGRYVILKSM